MVQPSWIHISAGIGGGNAVAEPLVAALVDDDEVEARADADSSPVAAEVAVLKQVAVGDGALVFHAGVGGFDEFVAVLREGVFAEVVLIGLKHAFGLGELGFGFVEVGGQGVEVEGHVTEAVAEVDVVADVERDVVIIDGVGDVPVPAGVSVAQIGLADELAVGNVDEIVGNSRR